MSALAVILIVLGALLLALFLGGLVANARVRRARSAQLRAQIEAADNALAAARAGDRGWDLEPMEQVARAAFTERSGGLQPEALHLVQVVDQPGTDADEAVFRVVSGDREDDVLLGREGGQWVAR